MPLLWKQDALQTQDNSHSCKGKMRLVLSYDDDITDLMKDNLDTDRSRVNVSGNDDSMEITIEAKDPVAMRAAVNGVLKTIIVYEKTRKVIE